MSEYVGIKAGALHEHTELSEYYCARCGYPVTDHDSYCRECGGAFQRGFATEPCDRDALLEIIEDLNICLEHAGPDIEREYVQLVRDRLLKACGGVISGEPDRH